MLWFQFHETERTAGLECDLADGILNLEKLRVKYRERGICRKVAFPESKALDLQ
jgi:hypothetical protein